MKEGRVENEREGEKDEFVGKDTDIFLEGSL